MPIVNAPASAFNGGTITRPLNVQPTSDAGAFSDVYIKLPAVPTTDALRVEDSTGTGIFGVAEPGSSGLFYAPDPHTNSASFEIANTGGVTFTNSAGDDYLQYSGTTLSLDPSNGQVDVKNGFLRLANDSAPADADLFNGSFAVWLDTGTPALKVKAKVGGSFVTGTVLLV